MFKRLSSLVIWLTLYVSQTAFGQFSPWVSGSILWGQGGAGLTYQSKLIDLYVQEDFTYDNGVKYSETSLMVSKSPWLTGVRFRNLRGGNDTEVAPFIANKTVFTNKYVSLVEYNELEYRNKSYVTGDDYLRFVNTTTLTSRQSFFEDLDLRPFVANSAYIDCEDRYLEKDRVYLGLTYGVSRMKFRLYWIPYFYGEKEENWDDKNKFGASVNLRF